MNSTGKANTVVVLEDEPAINKMRERVLSNGNYEVDTAVNGKVAKDMMAKKDYNLYLTDIRIPPGTTSEELYRWLQEKHPHLAERVVFTTRDVMGEETKRFLEQAAKLFYADRLLLRSYEL